MSHMGLILITQVATFLPLRILPKCPDDPIIYHLQ